MAQFQRYGFPFQYYPPYRRQNYYNGYSVNPAQPEPPPKYVPSEQANNNSSSATMQNRNSSKNVKSDNDVVWLNLFGINLYFDDVLILSLLFFLYKEEVKDEGLFLALVLLLIS